MGNLTHLQRRLGFFSRDIIDTQLELVRRRHFNNGKLRFEYNENTHAWEAKHKQDMIFDFFLGDESTQLDFPYSRYGTWGDWTRDLTIAALASLSNSYIWDDAEGEEVTWEGDPERYATFNKYVGIHARNIPNCCFRFLFRVLAWLGIPKGAR